MNRMAFGVAAILLATLTPAFGDDKKDEAKEKLLIGVWELTKGAGPKGSTIEFSPDGKIKVVADDGGKKKSIAGTYVLEGESLKLTLKNVEGKERTETMTIKTLTDKDLSWEDEKGKTDDFKKQEKKPPGPLPGRPADKADEFKNQDKK